MRKELPSSFCWIESIDYGAADSKLKAIYDSVRTPAGDLCNLYKAYALRSSTLKPADDLYRAALHDDSNTLPKPFSELLGTYVAVLSGCEYAATHHGHNYTVLLGDEDKAERVLEGLRSGRFEGLVMDQEYTALRYAEKLECAPKDMEQSDIDRLRRAGWTDGEILEINQVVATFSYFVRTIDGLGIRLGDEKIGLY